MSYYFHIETENNIAGKLWLQSEPSRCSFQLIAHFPSHRQSNQGVCESCRGWHLIQFAPCGSYSSSWLRSRCGCSERMGGGGGSHSSTGPPQKNSVHFFKRNIRWVSVSVQYTDSSSYLRSHRTQMSHDERVQSKHSTRPHTLDTKPLPKGEMSPQRQDTDDPRRRKKDTNAN